MTFYCQMTTVYITAIILLPKYKKNLIIMLDCKKKTVIYIIILFKQNFTLPKVSNS